MTPSRAPTSAAAVAMAALALATAALLRGIEPVATWFYPFMWIPTLVLADAVVAMREGRWFLFGRPAFTLCLFAWSAAFWLVFEIANLRLVNWFYVFVPYDRAARWVGILLSFATVLPAILVSERLLDSFGAARRVRTRPFLVTDRFRTALEGLGLAAIALCLLWPRFFFFAIWGGILFLADPFVHGRDPERSLLGDLERGQPGRVVRLLVGGLAIGLTWELYNVGARAKWIYTVPGLEDWKLFEMPVLGFLGFPVFALQGYAAWQALVVTGLAVPREGPPRPAPALPRLAAAALAAAFCALALLAVERATIASTTPRLADVPGAPAVAAYGTLDPFALARAEPNEVARSAGISAVDAGRWIEAARLVTLHGIGAPNAARLRAAGISTVSELAAADPESLAGRLAARGTPIASARLRVWVRAARQAAANPAP